MSVNKSLKELNNSNNFILNLVIQFQINNIDIVKILIVEGADINAIDQDYKQTPLMWGNNL
jgi:hypothetical protein